jgi:uncharacterized protein
MMRANGIYECAVMHQRLEPVKHGFTYRVFYLWLDLDELDFLDADLALFSRNRFNLFSFYDADHAGGRGKTAREGVLLQLQAAGVNTEPIKRIRMLAFPRVLGYVFNPVTFFYAYDDKDEPVCAAAQVTNTFLEQKFFVMPKTETDGGFHLVAPKHFYVSPFSDLEVCFDFKLKVPTDTVKITVDDRKEGRLTLATSLAGDYRALEDRDLLVCALKYPLLTLRVIFLIHWHAFRLWLKRIPWWRKAAYPHLQTDVLRPYTPHS